MRSEGGRGAGGGAGGTRLGCVTHPHSGWMVSEVMLGWRRRRRRSQGDEGEGGGRERGEEVAVN